MRMRLRFTETLILLITSTSFISCSTNTLTSNVVNDVDNVIDHHKGHYQANNDNNYNRYNPKMYSDSQIISSNEPVSEIMDIPSRLLAAHIISLIRQYRSNATDSWNELLIHIEDTFMLESTSSSSLPSLTNRDKNRFFRLNNSSYTNYKHQQRVSQMAMHWLANEAMEDDRNNKEKNCSNVYSVANFTTIDYCYHHRLWLNDFHKLSQEGKDIGLLQRYALATMYFAMGGEVTNKDLQKHFSNANNINNYIDSSNIDSKSDNSDTVTHKNKKQINVARTNDKTSISKSDTGLGWARCSHLIDATPCSEDRKRFLSSASHLHWEGVNGKKGRVIWLDLSNRKNDGGTGGKKDDNIFSSSRNFIGDIFLPLEMTLLSPSLELLWLHENPSLVGTLPSYIGEFTSLMSFSIYQTSLSGFIPNSLYNLSKLSSLRMYKSNFSGSISSEIGKLMDLKWLWVHDNRFSGSLPEEGLSQLKMLEGVTLHGNRFSPMYEMERGDNIPPSLCHLRENGTLKHLWTDCEKGSVIRKKNGDEDEGHSTAHSFIVIEDMRACSCCTRCFPR